MALVHKYNAKAKAGKIVKIIVGLLIIVFVAVPLLKKAVKKVKEMIAKKKAAPTENKLVTNPQ
ncbi:MAG: hypothetical protein V4613_03610 [Bacteroidota bacterium]